MSSKPSELGHPKGQHQPIPVVQVKCSPIDAKEPQVFRRFRRFHNLLLLPSRKVGLCLGSLTADLEPGCRFRSGPGSHSALEASGGSGPARLSTSWPFELRETCVPTSVPYLCHSGGVGRSVMEGSSWCPAQRAN